MPDLNMLVQLMRNEDCFKNLHNTKTAKQTIRKVITDWWNFRKALKAYNKDSSGFKRKPKPPKYKEKMAQVIFYNETIKGGQSKKKQLETITPTNKCFSIRSDRKFKQVIITPKTFGFVIEVQYEHPLKKGRSKAKDTSKASFLDHDPIPAYDENAESPQFSGSRVERGLYKTFRPIHADVNGSLNIGRKVIGDKVYAFSDRSIAAMPVRVNPLKVSA